MRPKVFSFLPSDPFPEWLVQPGKLDKELYYSDDEKFWEQMTKRQKSIFARVRQKRQKQNRRKLSYADVSWLENSKDVDAWRRRALGSRHFGKFCDGFVKSRGKGDEYSLSDFTEDVKKLGEWMSDVESEDDESDETGDAHKKEYPKIDVCKLYLCDICGKQCSKNQSLKEHFLLEHSDRESRRTLRHQCIHCRKNFSQAKHLQFHRDQFKGPCGTCGMVLDCAGLFGSHRKTHNVVCKMCGETFASAWGYRYHMESFHEFFKLECSYCSKKFFSLLQLNIHIFDFHKDKSWQSQIHKCEKCAFSTTDMKSLHVHYGIIHNAYRTFTCNVCHETFAKQISLEEHKKLHLGNVLDIECETNDIDINIKDKYIDHTKHPHMVKNSISEKPAEVSPVVHISYPCFPCEVVYATSDELHAHMRSVHDAPVYREERHFHLQQNSVSPSEKFSTPIPDCTFSSSFTMPLSLPASAVPLGVRMVEINGVVYRVVKE